MKNLSHFIRTMSFLLPLLMWQGMNAQEKGVTAPDQRTDWWGDIPGFLNQQSKISLEVAGKALKSHPPLIGESIERKMALLLVDNVLHNENAANFPSLQEFFRNRIQNAIQEISKTRVKKGAVIWKLYNHSFIVKTPSVTLGFDIQRGLSKIPGFTVDLETAGKLIEAVDILFISHLHGDHTDDWVAGTFLEQGKPVVSPPGIFSGKPFYEKILHPERMAGKIQEIALSAKNLKLQVIVYPGHQGNSILNNVYLVFTPEGLSFSQTGDQSNEDDFEWIDKVGDSYRVDVLMPNCWTTNPSRLSAGFRPRLILPGHENEMGHTVDHREPFWLNENRLAAGNQFPVVQILWGEKFFYQPGISR